MINTSSFVKYGNNNSERNGDHLEYDLTKYPTNTLHSLNTVKFLLVEIMNFHLPTNRTM